MVTLALKFKVVVCHAYILD